jgi:uncharacterized protein (TIGR03067 family)
VYVRSACLLVLAFFVTAGLVQGDDAQKERERLQGTWELTGAVGGGKPVPPEKVKGVRVVFSGEQMSLVSPGDEPKREFTFKLDPTAKPKAIDLTALDGGFKGKTNPGIYQLEGDTLKLCMRNEPTKERPAKLASPEGSDLILMTLKKRKR